MQDIPPIACSKLRQRYPGRTIALISLCLILAVCTRATVATEDASLPVAGEQTINGYLVRWNSVLSDFLPPSMIKQYQLKPKGQGILNVVVLRTPDDNGMPDNVAVEISVTVTDLLGQVDKIDMRPIIQNERISYLGTFEVGKRDQLQFQLEVQPPGTPAKTFEFVRRFHYPTVDIPQ